MPVSSTLTGFVFCPLPDFVKKLEAEGGLGIMIWKVSGFDLMLLCINTHCDDTTLQLEHLGVSKQNCFHLTLKIISK